MFLLYKTILLYKTTPVQKNMEQHALLRKHFDLDEDFDLNEDLNKKTTHNISLKKLLMKALTSCNIKWSQTSWLGIFVYVSVCCLNYIIGYYGIYRSLGWTTEKHSPVRVFGDIVTVGWFSLGFVALPWHQWEKLTYIQTRDCAGACRFLVWWLGTIIGFLTYGFMGTHPLFQTSLDSWSTLTSGQQAVYGGAFTTIGLIIIYWFSKLCPCGRCKKIYNPPMNRKIMNRKIIFIRVLILTSLLFVISYLLCSSDDSCIYHLHHWWFGFVLILLSSTSLDNWFDYLLQGIFWTFLIESIFDYGVQFGRFFI